MTDQDSTAFYRGKYRDIDGLNEDRAAQAQTGLDAFRAVDDGGEDDKSYMQYLICNLMHLAYSQDIDFAEVLRNGCSMWEQETNLSTTFALAEIAAPTMLSALEVAEGILANFGDKGNEAAKAAHEMVKSAISRAKGK